jgi:hypothetical protein
MTSPNGITWTGRLSANESNNWRGVCWSKELGLFVAVSASGSNRVMTSSNGITWTGRLSSNETNIWTFVCWSAELELFVAVAYGGTYKVMTSPNGINWTGRPSSNESNGWVSVCWSKELGIFAAVSTIGTNRVMTSSLKGRPPTSYNVFDSTFNSIDEAGNWTFLNLNAITLTANWVSVSSDDRLKHNEINISNGLTVIDQLCPKFYQKTQVMLDASYNGDLSGYIWNYEAGLIAQDLLKISDLSFVVSGGDIYEQQYNLITQTNDSSNNLYDSSNNLYDSSNNLYDSSNNLYTVSNILLKQEPYNVNYNSVFTYGLVAIKELHQIIDAQETTILKNETTINSLISRIEALENKP